MDQHEFTFTGTAKEYFGIWIVNILLSIVTLGIYGAWAKVRDKKYMYSNTHLDGHSFDYHATGKQIFIGRLIVFGALLFLGIMSAISPILYLVGILILLGFIPWIIIKAITFNARVSSYRNVRFNFSGDLAEAWATYVWKPIGNAFTLYLCTPFVSRASQRFISNNSHYGDRPMKFGAGPDKVAIGQYYVPFLLALAIAFGAYILVSIGMVGFIASSGLFEQLSENPNAAPELNPAIVGLVAVLYLGFFLAVVPATLFYRVWIRNVHFNNTIIDEQHHLRSDVHPGRFIWIAVSNMIVSVFSLGLMIPWGRVRMARYMASKTALETSGSLDGYSSSVAETAGVTAAEYADVEGFDIDIGI